MRRASQRAASGVFQRVSNVSAAAAAPVIRGAEDDAPAQCRLAEALYYDGRHDAALDLARAAFAAAGESEPVAEFCAWLFSNCGHHREAAAAYEALLQCRPGWAAGHRHASGSYAAAGDSG